VTNRLDTGTAHSARMYDYLLGGKDNFGPDRDLAERYLSLYPHARTAALENRAFMRRVVTWLTGDVGIRQYLDIGTGIPTSPNVHEIAQGTAPEARVVYVDNDPLVLAHARALLVSSPEGVTDYLDADVRDPDRILTEAARTLDLTAPVALTLVSLLHFLTDADEPYATVARLVSALPSGSYLVISHGTYETLEPEQVARFKALNAASPVPFRDRTRAEVGRFFDGLQLVDPGIVPVAAWRDDDRQTPRPPADVVPYYGAVARVP
jgi:S-adenosyl methyltransferase